MFEYFSLGYFLLYKIKQGATAKHIIHHYHEIFLKVIIPEDKKKNMKNDPEIKIPPYLTEFVRKSLLSMIPTFVLPPPGHG
jgi:hypothetical protein